MSLTPEQQAVCSEIWGAHVDGNSLFAAQSARAELAKIDHKNFSDQEVREFFCQLARIAAVTSNSAAKKSRTIRSATMYAQQSVRQITETYPLAETAEDARMRAEYWKGVYGEESSLFICLRDVLHVLQFVSQHLRSDEVFAYIGKVQQVLRDISVSSAPEQSERFHLIYQIEEAPFEEALAAFRTYHALHGPTMGAQYTKEQYETVSQRIFERCLRDRRHEVMEDLSALIPDGQLLLEKVQGLLRKRRLQQLVFTVQGVFAPRAWRKVQSEVTQLLRRNHIGEFSLDKS